MDSYSSTSDSGNDDCPSVSLYVGDLHPDVTEAMLYEKFCNAGPVMSIRVCRHKVTQRSLGYAYVNFRAAGDAERAHDKMNYVPIMDRPCRLMWSQRDPSLRNSGKGNVIVRNLDKSLGNKALYGAFSAFGKILSCKIAVDENEESRGFGFVHFETEESARNAIDELDDASLNGKRLHVSHFIPADERQKQTGGDTKAERQFTNVYVKHFSDEVDDDEKFIANFEQFGPVVSAKIMRNEEGKSKRYAFVEFEDHKAAEACVNKFHGEAVENLTDDGCTLYVQRAQKKAQRKAELDERFEKVKVERIKSRENVNLYVKNLEHAWDDERLREKFKQFGTITSAKVMRDATNHSKGFGFVCFSSPEEAIKAVTEMNGRILDGTSKPLYVALAQRKEARKAQLASQYRQRMNSMRSPTAPVQSMNQLPNCYIPGLAQQQLHGHYPMNFMPPVRPIWATLPPNFGPPSGLQGGLMYQAPEQQFVRHQVPQQQIGHQQATQQQFMRQQATPQQVLRQQPTQQQIVHQQAMQQQIGHQQAMQQQIGHQQAMQQQIGHQQAMQQQIGHQQAMQQQIGHQQATQQQIVRQQATQQQVVRQQATQQQVVRQDTQQEVVRSPDIAAHTGGLHEAQPGVVLEGSEESAGQPPYGRRWRHRPPDMTL